MKVFVSSLITGYESFREAAKRGIQTLRHQPVMAEDFGAQPHSPQVACLQGLRGSEAVILLLGANYGAVQQSGISPTHEEYQDAKGRKPVIAFVQADIKAEPLQEAFIAEVQAWEQGLFRGSFSSPDDLQTAVIQALHDLEIAHSISDTSPDELRQIAATMVPVANRTYLSSGSAFLHTAVIGGPRQQILRPADIERSSFVNAIHQEVLFGDHAVFKSEFGTDRKIDRDALVLSQKDGSSIRIDETGTLVVSVALDDARSRDASNMMDGSVLIEERVSSVLSTSISLASSILEQIDSTQKLSRIALAVGIGDAEHRTWRTAAEHRASPNSISYGMGRTEDRQPIVVDRPRAALRLDIAPIVEDVIVRLRRQWKSPQ